MLDLFPTLFIYRYFMLFCVVYHFCKRYKPAFSVNWSIIYPFFVKFHSFSGLFLHPPLFGIFTFTLAPPLLVTQYNVSTLSGLFTRYTILNLRPISMAYVSSSPTDPTPLGCFTVNKTFDGSPLHVL